MRQTRAAHFIALAMLTLALVGACGSESTPAPPSSALAARTPPPSSAPPPTSALPASAAPTGAPYALHEWGVIDVHAAEAHVTSGPERRIRAPSPGGIGHARKPVVYVHLLDDVAETTFTLHVTLVTGGVFRERYPAGTITGATIAWPSIVARREHCATAAAGSMTHHSAYGGPPICDTPDHVCELAELPRYDAPSAACLEVGDVRAGLLFYRGTVANTALPITATRADDGTLTVNASASVEGAPGGLIRIAHSTGSGALTIAHAPFPAAGATTTIAPPTDPLVRADAIAEFRHSLAALGMDDDEANAFATAWDCELFGTDPTLPAHAGTVLHPLADSLLYFLPERAVDAISTFDADPPPRTLRRAFLVRVDLGP